jgi:anaerobic selenocysteine-containing dehydrogenase
MQEWVNTINPSSEADALHGDPEFPLILQAGRHMDTNANTLMRDPAWNKVRRVGTLVMHPEDAADLDLVDGQQVEVTTEAGNVTVELELTETVRRGVVIMPHGFGLDFNGQTVGANVNRLTSSAHRDPLAGTPIHRYIRCRVNRG